MNKLTKEQKKIIYIGSGVLVFLIFFWVFVYSPRRREVVLIKEQINSAQSQINQINQLVGERDLAQVVRGLKGSFDRLKSQLPFQDEVVIRNLSQEARKQKIEVKNIVVSGKQALGEKIAGFEVQELFLSMDLTGEFKDLGEYLNILTNKFPVLVKVNKIDIKGKGEGKPNLDVSLQLSAYLANKQ